MKRNILNVGLFGLCCLTLFAGESHSYGLLSPWSRHNRYVTHITIRPYNAFTPICWGNMVCDGCSPGQCGLGAGCMPMHCGPMPCYGYAPCYGDASGASDLGMFYNPYLHPQMQHMMPPIQNAPPMPGPMPGPGPNPYVGPMPGPMPYGPGPGPNPYVGPMPYGPGPSPFAGPMPGPGPNPYVGPMPGPSPYGPGPSPFAGPMPGPGPYGPGPGPGPSPYGPGPGPSPYGAGPPPNPYGPGPGPAPNPYGPGSNPYGPQPGPTGQNFGFTYPTPSDITQVAYPNRAQYPSYYAPINLGWNQAVPSYWYGNGR